MTVRYVSIIYARIIARNRNLHGLHSRINMQIQNTTWSSMLGSAHCLSLNYSSISSPSDSVLDIIPPRPDWLPYRSTASAYVPRSPLLPRVRTPILDKALPTATPDDWYASNTRMSAHPSLSTRAHDKWYEPYNPRRVFHGQYTPSFCTFHGAPAERKRRTGWANVESCQYMKHRESEARLAQVQPGARPK